MNIFQTRPTAAGASELSRLLAHYSSVQIQLFTCLTWINESVARRL